MNDYDLSLAVAAERTFVYETRTRKERKDLVLDPLKNFLTELSHDNPREVVCFLGQHFPWPEDSAGVAMNMFLKMKDIVAPLGTLFGKTALELYRPMEVR